MHRLILVSIALWGCGGPNGGDPEPDNDLDGFTADVDCDDNNAAISPLAAEVCDGIDNDCNGLADDADPDVSTLLFDTFYGDSDEDGFGNVYDTVQACAAPEGYVANADDCNDLDDRISPSATEQCDGVDNDCDPSTSDAGVAFQRADGTWRSVTSNFATGTLTDPASLVLQEEGDLYVCSGTWYASIRANADVTIVGPQGRDVTILNGGGQVPGCGCRMTCRSRSRA